jgi:hypothetical protein
MDVGATLVANEWMTTITSAGARQLLLPVAAAMT